MEQSYSLFSKIDTYMMSFKTIPEQTKIELITNINAFLSVRYSSSRGNVVLNTNQSELIKVSYNEQNLHCVTSVNTNLFNQFTYDELLYKIAFCYMRSQMILLEKRVITFDSMPEYKSLFENVHHYNSLIQNTNNEMANRLQNVLKIQPFLCRLFAQNFLIEVMRNSKSMSLKMSLNYIIEQSKLFITKCYASLNNILGANTPNLDYLKLITG